MAKKPRSITLDRDGARWFVDAALSSMSSDDITPVICAAHVTVIGKEAVVVSTDRYRVTRATATLLASSGDHELLMPRTSIIWLGKNLAFFGRYGADLNRITIATTEEHELTVTIDNGDTDPESLTWRGALVKGNFPPVVNLFEKARAADESPTIPPVNLDFLAKSRVLGGRHSAPDLKFTHSPESNKPGPLLVTFKNPFLAVVAAEVLIQPTLR